jgi:HD superfamily phosphodiesterase
MTWKDKILEITREFNHLAWGTSHFKPIFGLSLDLANTQQVDVDNEALFPAAYLHDIGALRPYGKMV